MLTVAIDFGLARDVEEHISDKVDERLLKLRALMKEMDKKVLAKISPGPLSPESRHPRALLARLISGFDWRRALNSISGKEGHDRVRCITCRFIGEDCSTDVQRSQDVRRALRKAPGFVFQASMVLAKQERGGKSWRERVGVLLAGIAGTRGGECFILASTDSSDHLLLTLYSQPEWLASAVERITTYASGGPAAPFLTNLVGLGRCARGLQVVDPPVGSRPRFEVVSDVLSFIDLFVGSSGMKKGDDPEEEAMKRVLWQGSPPRSTPAHPLDLEKVRGLFRVYCAFEDMSDFIDFLQDFRKGGATALAKPEPRGSRAPEGSARDGTPAPSLARSASQATLHTAASPSRAAARSQARPASGRRSPSYGRSPSASSSSSSPRPRATRRSPSYGLQTSAQARSRSRRRSKT